MKRDFAAEAGILTADALLAIPLNQPERIFPNDAAGIKKVYRTLAMNWHPDKKPDARDVFDHVAKLHSEAERKFEAGTWEIPGEVTLSSAVGKTFKIKYLKKHVFELGEFYLTSNKAIYVVRKDYKDLFENGVKTIKGLRFANDEMKEKFSTYVPDIQMNFETKDGDHVLVVGRDPNTILLRDYLNHAGTIDPKHVAWIMSRLHNMTSYLQWAGLTHNAMTLDTCFILPKDHDFKRTAANPIAPKDHSVCVLGGWWYAVPVDRPLLGLPSQAINFASRAVLDSGISDNRLDHTMMRVIGRELLGDATGVKLAHDPKVPKPMANWLTLPGSGDAMEDFKTWRDKVLPECFGKPAFIELDIHPKKIYQPT